MENLTNEELVSKYQDNKCEEAFNELYIRSKGLLHSVRLSYDNDKLIDKECINSACHLGFFRAVTYYKQNHNCKFVTYCHLNMTSQVNMAKRYLLTKSRFHLDKKFVYLDAVTIDGEGTNLVNIINLDKKGKCTNKDYSFVYDAIDYAKTKILDKYHPYVIPILLKDITMVEVSELTNVNRRTITYTMNSVKSYARKYIDIYLKNGINN